MKQMMHMDEMLEALTPDDGGLRRLEWNWPSRWIGSVLKVLDVLDNNATDVTDVFVAYFMNKRMRGGVEVEQLLWQAAWNWEGCMPDSDEAKVACAVEVYTRARAVRNGCMPAHRMCETPYVPAVTPRNL